MTTSGERSVTVFTLDSALPFRLLWSVKEIVEHRNGRKLPHFHKRVCLKTLLFHY